MDVFQFITNGKCDVHSVIDWQGLHSLSVRHNVAAIAWDNIQQAIDESRILPEYQPSKALKIQWAMATEKVEQKYARQMRVIERLAAFLAEHNIKMMILKGYGLSLNYPTPNHRPCSDVDVWLFEERETDDGRVEKVGVQQKADALLREHFNIEIDEDKHHHTVFYIDGVMIENHYDFMNIHAHLSNRIIEARLRQLVLQPMRVASAGEATVYIPSADFHALFLLRHSAAHFAAERIVIRHLLDWRYLIEKEHSNIDWPALRHIAQETNMHQFLDCLNAICIDHIALQSDFIPLFERNHRLETRVWNEILQPEFSAAKPKNAGYIRSWSYMIRRWWANRWKHRIVYQESLAKTFIVQVWSHLLKPKSLKLH